MAKGSAVVLNTGSLERCKSNHAEGAGNRKKKKKKGCLLLCPPGEMVIVREEIRPKGYSSQGVLRASDKGVQEHGRKHLAGLAINGHSEHKRNINA